MSNTEEIISQLKSLEQLIKEATFTEEEAREVAKLASSVVYQLETNLLELVPTLFEQSGRADLEDFIDDLDFRLLNGWIGLDEWDNEPRWVTSKDFPC